MAILAISKLGNPILRQKALPVSPAKSKPRSNNLSMTCLKPCMTNWYRACRSPGGTPQQLVVMDCSGEGGFPRRCLSNPTIQFYGPEQVEVGRLSVSMGCGQGDAAFDGSGDWA